MALNFFSRIELEGELVEDEFRPFSTPSGYSVNMAPGSGLTAAYSRASADSTPVSTPAPAPTQVQYVPMICCVNASCGLLWCDASLLCTMRKMVYLSYHNIQLCECRLRVRSLQKSKKSTTSFTSTKQREQVRYTNVIIFIEVLLAEALLAFNHVIVLHNSSLTYYNLGAVSVPPMSPPVQPVVYSPVAGPPPHFHPAGSNSDASTTHSTQATQAAAQQSAVVTKPSAQAAVPAPVHAAALEEILPPPAPVAPVTTAGKQNDCDEPTDGNDGTEYSPPPFAPGHTPPVSPPAPVPAPSAPVDPMEAMLARLAALK